MPAYDDNDPAWPPRLRGYLEGNAAGADFLRRMIRTCLPPPEWFRSVLQTTRGSAADLPLLIPSDRGSIFELAAMLNIEGGTDGSSPKVQS
jgi:hypothetical protein